MISLLLFDYIPELMNLEESIVDLYLHMNHDSNVPNHYYEGLRVRQPLLDSRILHVLQDVGHCVQNRCDAHKEFDV